MADDLRQRSTTLGGVDTGGRSSAAASVAATATPC